MREMKDSGVAWIGRIPATWRTLTIGSLFKVRNEKVNDTDYLPLSVTKGGIVPQMENVAKSDTTDNRKKVLSGDFVINSRSDRKQSCGVSLIDGSVSLINTVLYPAKGAPIIQTYLNYLLKNYGFAEEFYRWGHGIVADLWTTRWQEMKSILIPVPPMDEQRKILNAASAQIDSLIEIIQTQIERLNDYRTSVISSHTSDTSFRHLKLKRVVNNVEQGWSPSPTERKDGDDWQVLTLAAVKFGSQCVVVAIDAKRREDGSGWNIYKNGGRVDMGMDAVEWAMKVDKLGAGEILLTSMDCDGVKQGYDIELTKIIAENVSVPVIASGGAGTMEHFYDALTEGKADAALAASLFHYKELEINDLKHYLDGKGVPVRL